MYLDSSVKPNNFTSKYQKLNLTRSKYEELKVDLQLWTANHDKIKVEPKTFYPLNFNGILEETFKDLLKF
jgi:hypothetical protein